MKHLKYYKLFEKVKSYKWFNSTQNEYTFSDDIGNNYIVEFTKKGNIDEVEVKYFVNSSGNRDMNIIVNNNPYRTLETVLGEILIHYINTNKDINTIHIHGLGKDTEKEYITQRTKLYTRYLKNNPIPGFELYSGTNDIELVRI